ncbi:protein phosphatase 1 regulatory subunit SDS22 isoform X1 [Telopea speciosissima]|uniref:protein phosphatase 1 regulatory subunit SDS22 isoform X1 n=1 Tax=Telopea speciosissima TaxID=54955 RepID=UPI001CC7F5C7|nr:protein phosphatase 1 regulatory subunit SDS22 isoform X1 [Telopea speciosissima]XP_043714356.1 protein phosphatase 1 regulatory subunit SDS22 isoform X1 [Telopea speciosissima]
MNRLTTKQILQEKQSGDPNSVAVLLLHHKALSDVSCLNDFKSLERLDLGFNNLSSLEGLRSCVNLKWLSVLQNKLQSLKGIEGLSKLMVLNAGKNKLKAMDEVRSLISLRALILNDNDIASICKLDGLKDLNTLVLSRNPICEIGNSLVNLKSITKLSLSNCQLQTVGSSLNSCVDLREVRLAHNGITTLPAAMAHNIKIRNLDLGNNSIISWSDLQVLSSLSNLKNLNLQGNPVAERDKLAKKVKKLVPNLQIFNGRPIERSNKALNQDLEGHKIHRSHIDNTSDLEDLKAEKRENPRENKNIVSGSSKDDITFDNQVKRKSKIEKNKIDMIDVGKVGKLKRLTTKEEKIVSGSSKRKSKAEKSDLDVIDDGETPFMELIVSGSAENLMDGDGKKNKYIQDVKYLDGLAKFPPKRKKSGKCLGVGRSAMQLLSPATEVGMGGPSAWDA